jgi:drug/metabolite transporter (DMT)-like permease
MPTAADGAKGASVWAGLLTLYLIWGSTYLAIAIAVETIPPFLMAAFRFSIAGLILLTWSMAREGRSFVVPTKREWRDSAVVGAALIGGGMGLAAWGEQTVPSGVTALVIALMPAWAAILGRILYRERQPGLALVGIVTGFVGIAILAAPSFVGGTGALEPFGLAAVMLSPVAWAAGSVFASHGAVLPRRPLVASGLQMLIGGAVLAVAGLLTGELGDLDLAAITGRSAFAVVYLIVLGSLIAFTVYGWMLRVAPLPFVSTYAYVNPIIAVILGAIILNEPLDLRTVVAGAVIVLAVSLIVTARGRMAPVRTATEAATDTVLPEHAPDGGLGPEPAASASRRPALTD